MIKNIEEKFKELNKHLKKKYVGIDYVIDEVLFHVENWLRFKDFQEVPYIICMWGMTGTGKTSLIKEIVNELKLQDIYFPVDMGYAQHSERRILDFDGENYSKDYGVFALDEFHYLVSHDKGEDKQVENSRIIWNFLDNGKIDYNSIDYDVMYKLNVLVQVLRRMKKINFKLNLTRIEDKLEIFKTLLNEFRIKFPTIDLFQERGYHSIDIEDDYIEFIPKYFLESLFENILQNEDDRNKFMDLLNKNKYDKHIEAINFAISKGSVTKGKNLEKSIVFIMGNLDDAFQMVYDVTTDNEADDIKALSEKVEIVDIRNALFKKYKPEQIGRLGNNHIVYQSLSKAEQYKVIELKLDELSAKFFDNTSIKVEYDDSILDLIYNDGAVPSQGVRPIISTLNSYIRGNLNLILSHAKETTERVLWSFNDDKYHFHYFNKDGEKEYQEDLKIRLKQSELTKKRNKDNDLIVAVHEAAHALIYILLNGKLPKRVLISKGKQSGWNFYDDDSIMTKKSLENDIAVRHAGILAEQIVFGDDNVTVGAQQDLVELTELALDYYAKYGFGDYKYTMTSPRNQKNIKTYEYDDEVYRKAKELIEKQRLKAESIIKEHKKLFNLIVIELNSERSLSENQIRSIIEKHNYNHLLKTGDSEYFPKYRAFLEHNFSEN